MALKSLFFTQYEFFSLKYQAFFEQKQNMQTG